MRRGRLARVDSRVVSERLEPRTLLAAAAWDGEGLDGDWHNPLNWAGDVLPGAGDDVTIEADPTPGSTPDITIAAGETAEIRSLELGKALTLAGILSVSARASIGDIALTIAATGSLSTADLTLVGGSGPVANAGSWTISGYSFIDRAITSSGTLGLALGSRTTLREDSVAESVGSVASTGAMWVASGAYLAGAGKSVSAEPAVAQLTVGGGSTLDLAAITVVRDLHIVVGALTGAPANVDFSSTVATALIDCHLEVIRGRLSGRFDGVGTDLTIRTLSYLIGQARLDSAQVAVGALLLLQGASPGLELFDSSLFAIDSSNPVSHAEIEGEVVAVNSTIVTGPQGLSFPNTLTLRGSSLQGAGHITVNNYLNMEGSIIGPGVSVTTYDRVSLIGEGMNWIQGHLRLHSPDEWTQTLLDWRDGDLLVEGAGAITLDGRWSVFTVNVFNGTIAGDGSIQLLNGARLETVQDLTIQPTLNNEGTVRITNADLILAGPVVQVITVDAATRPTTPWALGSDQSVHLTGGRWEAIFAARLHFGQRIDWSSATLVFEDNGAIPALGHKPTLGGQLINDGEIVLRGNGSGQGLMGTGYSLRLANSGTIRTEDAGHWRLIGDLYNHADGQVHLVGLTTIRAKNVTNFGTVEIDARQGDARLRVTGRFAHKPNALLQMRTGIVQGSLAEPTLSAKRFDLSGRFRLDTTHSLGALRPGFAWDAVEADKRRNGRFGQVTLNVSATEKQFLYPAKRFRIAITV